MNPPRGIRLCTVAASLALVAAAVPGWAAGGSPAPAVTVIKSMAQPRTDATATVLSSGDVLVAGGAANGQVTNRAELFNPATGSWRPTGSLAQPRYGHVAARLAGGRVLVAGGQAYNPASLGDLARSTEIYTPTTGTWRAGAAMSSPHVYPAVAVLKNGTVLVAGGSATDVNEGPVVGETWLGATAGGVAEIYDQQTSSWTTTGSMLADDTRAHSVVLGDGRVFTGCGTIPGDFEIYDPASVSPAGVAGQWHMTSPAPAVVALCAMTLLPDGRVLVAGGNRYDQQDQVGYDGNGNIVRVGGGSIWPVPATAAASIYNPATDTWTRTGAMNAPRAWATATALTGGRVLVSGGADTNGAALPSTEVFNVLTGQWAAAKSTPRLRLARDCCETTSLLPHDGVLIAGGMIGSGTATAAVKEAEIVRL